MQLKIPVPLTVAPHAETVAPPLTVVATVAPGVNPVPDRVADDPEGPSVGEIVIAGAVIVNDALALSKLPSEPAAVTEYAVVDAVPVTFTMQLNAPESLTVEPHVVMLAPALIVNATVTPGVNPAPETFTEAPLGPWTGAIEMAGEVIVKGAFALSKLPSDPVAVRTYPARVTELMVTEQSKEPVGETVAPQSVAEAPELIVVVMAAPGVNPVPVTVAEAPLGPWEGVSEIEGEVTVKAAPLASKLPSEPVAVTL